MNSLIVAYGELAIIKSIVPNFELNKAVSSPLRNDNKASFSWYVTTHSTTNRQLLTTIFYYDFANGNRGDIVEYVKQLKKCDFNNAVLLIKALVLSINLPIINGVAHVNNNDKALSNKRVEYELDIDEQDMYNHISYFRLLGLNYDDLALNDIYILNYLKTLTHVANHVTSTTKTQTANSPILAYIFNKATPKECYKFYEPFSDSVRFYGNVPNSLVSGYSLLDLKLMNKDKLVLIAKSKKDEMWLRKHVYQNVISFQTEHNVHEKTLLAMIKAGLHIIIVADNDNTGIQTSLAKKEYIKANKGRADIICIAKEDFPDIKLQKDYTDLAVTVGNDIAIDYIKRQIVTVKRKYNEKRT
jgi:hypothetical protein